MIPEILKLEGLYSYAGRQTIDFSRLCEAGLFGIFGAVGSGKSAILEAIAYALYGETERLNKREQRGYNMMNLKSDRLLIDFRFRAGNLGQESYRFTVTGQRNKKRFQEVGTLKRVAYQMVEEEWIPLESADGERVTGLSYDHFRRTIIIPQGRFQEFLHLGEKDRSEMLQEIFELERFDLQERVSTLLARNKSALDVLQGELNGIPDHTKEALAAQEVHIAEGKQALEKLKTLVADTEGVVRNLEQLKKTHQQLELKQADFQMLEAEREEREAEKLELEQYAMLEREFLEKLAEEDSLEKQVKDQKADLNVVESSFEVLQVQVTELESKLTELEPAYENRQELWDRAEELLLLTDIKERDKGVRDLSKRIEKGTGIVAETKSKERSKEAELEKLKTSIREEKAALDGKEQLWEVKNWLQRKQQLLAEVKQREVESRDMQARKVRSWESWQYSWEDALHKKLVSEQVEADPAKVTATGTIVVSGWDQQADQERATAIRSHIQACREEVSSRLKNLETDMHTLLHQEALARYTESLEEGTPCPLCGSAHHPKPYHKGETAQRKALLESGKQELEQRREALLRLESDWERFLERQRDLEPQMATAERSLTQARSMLQEHKGAFCWPAYQGQEEADVDRELQRTREKQAALQKMEQNREQRETELQELRKNVKWYEESLEGFIRDREKLMATRELQISELVFFDWNEYRQLPEHELEQKAQALKSKFQTVTADYQKGRDQHKVLAEHFRKIEQELVLSKQKWQLTTTRLQEVKKILVERCTRSGMDTLETIRQVLSVKRDVAAGLKAIQDWRQQLESTRQQVKALEAEMAGKAFDNAEYEAALAELEGLRRQLESAGKSLATEEMRYQNMLAERALREEKVRQKEALEARKANLGQMRTLFKGKGFVNYVSTVYLRELCERANARFRKLTRNTLLLEVDEKNNFMVRDYLNGGEVRNVKTLSGGQTFQASLSLALALADSIQQKQRSSHNFFFLDEGFGTLDKASLGVVFDTLKALRKENRIVGVISHVEELQQEIDVYLRITRDDEGSKVKASWQF